MLKAYLAQLIDEKDLEDVFNILTAFRRYGLPELAGSCQGGHALFCWPALLWLTTVAIPW